MKRTKAKPSRDKKLFSRTAVKTKPLNYRAAPSRGGWRI